MTVLAPVLAAIRKALVWVGFWSAVTIPLAYFYLFYNGLTGPELLTLGKLVGLHVLAFVVGRGYNGGTATDAPASSYPDQNRTA